jgi:Fe-S-cluster-containing hydrogenase component 2
METCPSQAIEEELGKYKITDRCEGCGSCMEMCFLEAIEEY